MDEAFGWIGQRVDDVYGGRLGKVEGVLADPVDGSPQWLLVNTRRFEQRLKAVPVTDAVSGGGHVWIPYEREVVKTSPEIAGNGPLEARDELLLCEHYDLAQRAEALAARPAEDTTVAPAGAVTGL